MKGAAGAVVTLALLVGIVGIATAAPACDACLTAGAGRATLALPPGTPLGGYGGLERRRLLPDFFDRHAHAFWLKPSTGQREPLAARALVLERDGTRVTWLTLDLVAVDQTCTRLVAAPPASITAVASSAATPGSSAAPWRAGLTSPTAPLTNSAGAANRFSIASEAAPVTSPESSRLLAPSIVLWMAKFQTTATGAPSGRRSASTTTS